jgi:hypothetical protein
MYICNFILHSYIYASQKFTNLNIFAKIRRVPCFNLDPMKKTIFILLISLCCTNLFAQKKIINGIVSQKVNNTPIAGATISIQGTSIGTISDEKGYFEFNDLEAGTYNFVCSAIGFKTKIEYEITVDMVTLNTLNFDLESTVKDLKEVKIKIVDRFYKIDESPLSVRNLGVNEIQRNPGSNRDISKVLQSLPGVAATVSYRNDLLVRGGGPGENKFYLDGIEIPNINHFATQGSTGGPVGLLNVDFIKEANFYSGAFPANRGNSMSSVLELKNKDGRTDRWGGRLTTGYTASGLSLEGPVTKKSSILLSARQSYLQVLFKQIGLPFLPTFTDFQIKYTIKPNKKNEIIIMGLNGIDKFKFNKAATLNKDSARAEYARFVLDYLPRFEQENNSIGINWKRFHTKGFWNMIVSRSALDNHSSKYYNNEEENPAKKIFTYESYEAELKARLENTFFINGLRFNVGVGGENAYYTNQSFIKFLGKTGIDSNVTDNSLSFTKMAIFGQATKSYWAEKLVLSLGLRTDFNTYSKIMINPLNQLSPRFSASFAINPNVHLNFNTGLYYQLPAYTVLGYRNNVGELTNKTNNVKYLESKHLVIGADYFTKFNSKFVVEGFYKLYNNYPFSIRNQVSLANIGSDFGVIGNEPITSTNSGRAYGVELSYQQKLFKGFYGIFTYTFVKSEFENANNKYVVASWDYGNIINTTIGKKFKKGLEMGAKLGYQGGQPYTPYNEAVSMNINNYSISGQGVPDYNLLNTQRTQTLFNVDFRISKKWDFKHLAIDIYADVQNLLGTKTKQQDFLTARRDANNNFIVDPNNASAYLPRYVPNFNGVRTPNLGIVVEF